MIINNVAFDELAICPLDCYSIWVSKGDSVTRVIPSDITYGISARSKFAALGWVGRGANPRGNRVLTGEFFANILCRYIVIQSFLATQTLNQTPS